MVLLFMLSRPLGCKWMTLTSNHYLPQSVLLIVITAIYIKTESDHVPVLLKNSHSYQCNPNFLARHSRPFSVSLNFLPSATSNCPSPLSINSGNSPSASSVPSLKFHPLILHLVKWLQDPSQMLHFSLTSSGIISASSWHPRYFCPCL